MNSTSVISGPSIILPTEIDRQILALSFDDDKVSKIETKTLADTNNIAIDQEETLPANREQGFFRKYFGGVGTYMPFGNGKSEKGL